ncbi:MAG: bifunctional DNA primase/polymerase [Candidatus Limnocylindrales bacterium]
MALERPTADDRIKAALWFADHGFRVFSVWSTTPTGICRCPKGRACEQAGKHPATQNGFKDATADRERIRAMLSAGSEPNYGMLCPDGVFALDVDGDGVAALAELEARYGPLPPTLRTNTAHGQHVFLRWPAALPRPIGQLFGYVTRWGTGRDAGYVIGPRSIHASGAVYSPGDTFEIAELPEPWAKAAVSSRPSATALTVTGSYQMAGRIPASRSRYEEIRAYTAHLYNKMLSVDEMWPLVRDVLAPRFAEPLSEPDLRGRFERATAKLTERLGTPSMAEAEPAVPPDLEGELFVNVVEYNAKVPDDVPWAAYPIAYFGGVTLLAGIWKGGKSTLMAQFQRARESGEAFLGSAVPVGPTVLVTEEGGIPVKRKTSGLTELRILDRQAAVLRHLHFDDVLSALEVFCSNDQRPAVLFLDTFAVWGDIEDENDAPEVTVAIAKLTVLAQRTGASVVLVHHVRKEGGSHGRGIRGSGAMAATVDIFAVLDYPELVVNPTERILKIEGRVLEALNLRLGFEPIGRRYDLLDQDEADLARIEKLVLNVADSGPGATVSNLMAIWDASRTKAKADAEWLVAKGRMRKSLGKIGNASAWQYWSVPAAFQPEEDD